MAEEGLNRSNSDVRNNRVTSPIGAIAVIIALHVICFQWFTTKPLSQRRQASTLSQRSAMAFRETDFRR